MQHWQLAVYPRGRQSKIEIPVQTTANSHPEANRMKLLSKTTGQAAFALFLISLLLPSAAFAQIDLQCALWRENVAISNSENSPAVSEVATKIDKAETKLMRENHVKSVTKWVYAIDQSGSISQQGTKSEAKMYDARGNVAYYWEPSENEFSFKYDSNGNRTEAVNKLVSAKFSLSHAAVSKPQLLDGEALLGSL
ncbi:MAG: hypothetical protein WCE75_05785 [Terracidiphilus sp.]